jgi:hypothetical protein
MPRAQLEDRYLRGVEATGSRRDREENGAPSGQHLRPHAIGFTVRAVGSCENRKTCLPACEHLVSDAECENVRPRIGLLVIELRDGAGFAIQAFAELRVDRQRVGEDLDRHRAIEPRVARAIDFPHPAGAEGGFNLVWTESGAWSKNHSLRSVIFFSAAEPRWQILPRPTRLPARKTARNDGINAAKPPKRSRHAFRSETVE